MSSPSPLSKYAYRFPIPFPPLIWFDSMVGQHRAARQCVARAAGLSGARWYGFGHGGPESENVSVLFQEEGEDKKDNGGGGNGGGGVG